MHILSIDWDYFVDIDAGYKSRYFPDGGNENIPEAIQNIIWQGRYAQSIVEGKDIRKIKIRKEYNELYDYLKHEQIPFHMIVESHKDCYYFVSGLQKMEMDNIEL